MKQRTKRPKLRLDANAGADTITSMKTYIVYVNGIETAPYVKAASDNAAEKKAQKRHSNVKPQNVSVAYTEV